MDPGDQRRWSQRTRSPADFPVVVLNRHRQSHSRPDRDPQPARPERENPGGSWTVRPDRRWPEDAISGETDLGFLWVVVGDDFR